MTTDFSQQEAALTTRSSTHRITAITCEAVFVLNSRGKFLGIQYKEIYKRNK